MEPLIIQQCKSTMEGLLRFSMNLLSLGDPILDNRIEQLEREIGYALPIDFKYFISRYNGFSLCGTEVFGLGRNLKESSLDKVYFFEHNIAEYKMPPQFLPFSNDGRGNHYCLDLSEINELGTCPIIFWQWDFNYESFKDVEVCNANFCEWVKEVMIEWTLESYDYDGTEK